MKQDKGKLLIIDDEPLIRRAINRILSHDGWTVLEASDGKEGLQIIHDNSDIKFVFLDWIMPGMSGSEVIAVLKENGFDLKRVIVVTALSEIPENVTKEIKTVLYKPFQNINEIIEALK
ncbi:MAG: response regulator [Bdellovibrionaceae bacterium]|nr:response regulator [Pseudobdellovibrionaceae bacterium]MDW8189813.1 response regulator [Pseudobdellovibrionaceae bacterium]